MPGEPPHILERLIGLFIPPSRREDVLGDLRERYASLWRYVGEAIRTTPLVILSAVRRATDPQLFLMEALLLYISFLSALWFMNRAMLYAQWGLLRPAIPAAIATTILLLYDAWTAPEKRAPSQFSFRMMIAICITCVSPFAALPTIFGAAIGALLVSAVRMLFLPGTDLPQRAGGPTRALRETSPPAEESANAKRFRNATVTVVVLVAILVALRYGGMPLMILATIAVVVFQLKSSWKE